MSDEFAGLRNLLPPWGWPSSIVPHHPKTMAQRSKRTKYQLKDINGRALLHMLYYTGGFAPVEAVTFGLPHRLVAMRLERMARQGLVEWSTWKWKVKATEYGIAVLIAWDVGATAPRPPGHDGKLTTGTIGGRPRVAVIGDRHGKTDAMMRDLCMHVDESVGPDRSYFIVRDNTTGQIVPERSVRIDVERMTLEEKTALAARFWGVTPVIPEPPKVRIPHKPRQDRCKRPRYQHWMKR